MDQVDLPETGVVTSRVIETVAFIVDERPELLFIADSRRGLRSHLPVCLKMNAAELSALTGARRDLTVAEVKETAASLAQRHHRHVFVTLAERGIVGAPPRAEPSHVAALPVRGEIDIVGAGDAVTANLVAALAAGATVKESCEIAMVAASIVIHQLGTTGTASAAEIEALLTK
jgi:bifunctional ADP-heptose synthase (sugar kinase/adenylyltransferase)